MMEEMPSSPQDDRRLMTNKAPPKGSIWAAAETAMPRPDDDYKQVAKSSSKKRWMEEGEKEERFLVPSPMLIACNPQTTVMSLLQTA